MVRDEATGAWSVAEASAPAALDATRATTDDGAPALSIGDDPAAPRDTHTPAPAEDNSGGAAPPGAAGPLPAEQTPRSRPARSGHRLAAVVAGGIGLLVAAASAGAHALVARALPVPASLGEATLGANAYALSRFGELPIQDSLAGQVLSVHVGVYNELTAAAERHASVAGSAREFLLVVAVVSALALFTLSRQLGLSGPAAAAAALVGGLAPAVVSAQILVFPATVAVMWLLLAGVVIAAKPTTASLAWLGRLVSAVLVALAALIAPLVIAMPAGIFVAAAMSGVLFRRSRLSLRVGICVLVSAAVVGVLLLAPGVFDSPDSPIRPETALALGSAGLALAALTAWRVRWLRPVALGCLPILLLALLPVGGQPTAVIATVPVLALLLVGFVEECALGSRPPTRRLWHLTAATVAVIAAVGLAVLPVSATDAQTGTPQLELGEWIETNIGPETTVQVAPLLWVELVRAGVREGRLQRTDEPAADVPVPELLAERGGTHAGLPLVARFGTGPLAISVRERVPDIEQAVATRTAEQQASAEFGAVLRDNPNIVLQGTAGPDLASGRVDSRVLTVLATASADFTYTVESFPRRNGDPDVGTLRTVRLSGIQPQDGSDEGSAGVALRDYFRFQLAPYRPLQTGFDDGVLIVTYSAPSPVGLLG